MVIFGGGYDKCEDNDTTFTCNSASTGNHIYVLDADTGALLKTFDTLRPVPGDITVIRLDCHWPLVTPFLRPFFPGGRYDFSVSATMRNEMFTP